MDFYDLLFARFLNKGGDTPTPTPTPTSDILPSLTVTIINNTGNRCALIGTKLENNTIYSDDIIVEVDDGDTKTATMIVPAQSDGENYYASVLNSEHFFGGSVSAVSDEVNCVGGEWDIIITDMTKPASCTVTMETVQ